MTAIYLPRHRADQGFGDVSMLARLAHDQVQGARAVKVLAATETLDSTRTLYRELHRAGVLRPIPERCRTVRAADIIAREASAVAA